MTKILLAQERNYDEIQYTVLFRLLHGNFILLYTYSVFVQKYFL